MDSKEAKVVAVKASGIPEIDIRAVYVYARIDGWRIDIAIYRTNVCRIFHVTSDGKVTER